MAGRPEEIKTPAAFILDDSARGMFSGADPARMAVWSYGLEYPAKMVCRNCFQTLLRVFAD